MAFFCRLTNQEENLICLRALSASAKIEGHIRSWDVASVFKLAGKIEWQNEVQPLKVCLLCQKCPMHTGGIARNMKPSTLQVQLVTWCRLCPQMALYKLFNRAL